MRKISKIKTWIHFIFSFLILIILPLGALANENGKGGACKADVEKFCKEVKPGDGRIIQCLKENHENLSGECKQKLSEMKEKMTEKMKEIHEACKEDMEEFCNEVKPGDGRIMQCLKKHEEHISSKCKNSFHGEEHQKEMQNMKDHQDQEE